MVRRLALLVLACASWLPSCGETTFEVPFKDAAGPPLTVTYLLEGGGADGLQALFLNLTDIQLVQAEASGGGSVGALPEPVTVELLGLEDRAKLLTTRYYGDGVFTQLRIQLAAEPLRVVGHDGIELTLESDEQRSITVALDEPFRPVLGGFMNRTVVIHVSPDESVTCIKDVGGEPTYRFRPVVRARVLQAGEQVAADDYWGGLRAASDDYRRLEIASELDRTVAQRAVVASVSLTPSTLLLQPNGQPAATLPGLSSIPELMDARIWVRGKFTASAHPFLPEVRATSVLLDSLTPSSGSDASIVAEVRIVGVEAGGVFLVRPIEIERGGDDVVAALAPSRVPCVWRVHLGASATVLGASPTASSSSDLSVGMRVKLHFPALDSEPFEVARAVMQGPPEHFGRVAEPQIFDGVASVFLAPESAAIASGLVANTKTIVDVQTGSLFATLDVEGSPHVLVRTLPPGVRAVVHGPITGAAEEPRIESGAVVVRPGRFHGFVSAANESSGTFDATVESIEAPFGDAAQSPPFLTRLTSNAVVEGSATSSAEVFELFSSLGAGERLAVTVAGLATGEPNSIDAYQIHVSVVPVSP